MTTTLILDADLILHRAASMAQALYRFDEGAECVSTDFAAAKDKAQSLVHDWSRALFADRIVLALSDPTGRYFRKEIFPAYKSHRSGHAKPLLFKNLRSWAEESYECVAKPGLEADDVCGILSTHPSKYPGTRIVVSTDKDMLQIPGLLYRPHKPKDGVLEITPAEADRWHLIQTLTGDSTDGFKGIPGVGPKKAVKILDAPVRRHTTHSVVCDCHDWSRVSGAYVRAGLSHADALLQARVARILRHGDYHQDIGVRLWSPEL